MCLLLDACAQLTPLTAVLLGEVLAEAGLPRGVFNVIQGLGETGALMTKHPGFAKFSFTGSVPTGTKIMQAGKIYQAFFFGRFDENSGPKKTQVFTQTQVKFALKLRFSAIFS